MSELKVTADHLKRDAYLYVRQSTLRQVAENGESTQRQYALRHRAIAAGWPAERVRVIDRDLGKSGSTAVARDGFQELVSEVALAKAGIVMGLEVSRLARNSADWHRLIELCALTATLILDEDGIYDPSNFNDRLSSRRACAAASLTKLDAANSRWARQWDWSTDPTACSILIPTPK